MFSTEFGKDKQAGKFEKKHISLEAFLSKHYVICQQYRITEDI